MEDKQKEEIIKKWEESGLLDILLIVSKNTPHLKPHITETNVEQFIEGLKRKK